MDLKDQHRRARSKGAGRLAFWDPDDCVLTTSSVRETIHSCMHVNRPQVQEYAQSFMSLWNIATVCMNFTFFDCMSLFC